MISIDDRISYYLGNQQPPFNLPNDYGRGMDVPICIDIPTYPDNYYSIHGDNQYYIDIFRIMRMSKKPKLWIQCGDASYVGVNFPVLTKIRDTQNPDSKGVIMNLNSSRHMSDIFDHTDIEWGDKITGFVWRGTDTNRYGTRLNFVKEHYKSYNVGFSHYCQGVRDNPEQYTMEYIKGHTDISEMLHYKYLPVIDGNDKSSSLGWVMASNSVPIMPIPRYHSWMCEPWLKPGIHYVECKPDFSDFLQVIEWCQDNDQKCKEIAENGKKFMLQFMNSHVENYIEKKIIEYVNEHQ